MRAVSTIIAVCDVCQECCESPQPRVPGRHEDRFDCYCLFHYVDSISIDKKVARKTYVSYRMVVCGGILRREGLCEDVKSSAVLWKVNTPQMDYI